MTNEMTSRIANDIIPIRYFSEVPVIGNYYDYHVLNNFQGSQICLISNKLEKASLLACIHFQT
jgi:hypothetical protein